MWNKKIPENLLPRDILETLKEDLDEPEITLLFGARQTGKTSLIYLLLDFLIRQKNIAQEQIFYFDLENIIETERLNKIRDFEKFIQLLKDEGADFQKKIWVFIDEIQYLDYPSNLLKYIYNHYKSKIKFVVSGSSSLEIKKKFTDRLTGRLHPRIINTLNFYEYLYFLEEKNLAAKKSEINVFKIFEEKEFIAPPWVENLGKNLQEHFENFAIFGGYPGIVLKKDKTQWSKDLMSIYSLYVRKDIKDLAEIGDVKGFNNLVNLAAYQIGNLINESELSIGTGLSRQTIKKYLFLLENTFVISLLRPFYTNARLEYSKMPKVFFNDPGLCNGVINNFRQFNERGDAGRLVENTVFSELNKKKSAFSEIHFWRSERGTEVDFVLKNQNLIPLEIKYQSFGQIKIPSGLRSFIKKYQPQKAFVITKDFFANINFQGVKVIFLPAWAV